MVSEWRQALSDLIDRELELTHELGEALAGERDALRSVDPVALDAATSRKQGCIEDLSTLDIERQHLCSSAGMAPDRDGMERLSRMIHALQARVPKHRESRASSIGQEMALIGGPECGRYLLRSG